MAETLHCFLFDPRTRTIPVRIAETSNSQPFHDKENNLIGFVSFDEATHPTDNLLYAHISTLRDDCTHAAIQQMDETKAQSIAIPQPPILAYALVLRRTRTGETKNEYARDGLAEVNYEWMTAGSERVVKLV